MLFIIEVVNPIFHRWQGAESEVIGYLDSNVYINDLKSIGSELNDQVCGCIPYFHTRQLT